MANFTRSSNNPLFTPSDVSWSSYGPRDTVEFIDPATGAPATYNGKYWHTYTTTGASPSEIGIASSTSLDGNWTDESGGAVLSPNDSGAGTWESTNVSGSALLDMRNYATPNGYNFWLLYTGQEGTGSSRFKSIGLAKSNDMVTWTRYGSNPVFSPTGLPGGLGGENFSVLEADNGNWYAIYEDEGTQQNGVRTAETTNSFPDSGWSDMGKFLADGSEPAAGWMHPCMVKTTVNGTTYYDVFAEEDPTGTQRTTAAYATESQFHSQGGTLEGTIISPSGSEAHAVVNGAVHESGTSYVYFVDDADETDLATGGALAGDGTPSGTPIAIPTTTGGGWSTTDIDGTAGGPVAATDTLPSSTSVRNEWYYDEGTGTTAADSAGTADGTITNLSWVSDASLKGGYGLDGQGTSGDVDVGTLGTFGSDLDTNWSLAFTVDAFTASTRQDVLGVGHGSGDQYIIVSLSHTNAGDVVLALRDPGGNSYTVRTTNGGHVNDGGKHRVAVVKTGNTGTSGISVYIDGSSVSTSVVTDQGFGGTAPVDFQYGFTYFGWNQAGTLQNPLAAVLDWPRTWDYDLSSTEVSDDYNAQNYTGGDGATTVIDDLESGGITAYSGATTAFGATQTNVTEGSWALEKTSASINDFIYSTPGDGLAAYPSEGDTVAWLARNAGGGVAPGILVAAGAGVNGYLYQFGGGDIQIWRIDNSAYTDLAQSTAGTYSADTWYWFEGRVPSSGDSTLTLTAYEVDTANLTRGTQIDSVSTTDATYVSQGVGWGNASSSATGTIGDWLRIV